MGSFENSIDVAQNYFSLWVFLRSVWSIFIKNINWVDLDNMMKLASIMT